MKNKMKKLMDSIVVFLVVIKGNIVEGIWDV